MGEQQAVEKPQPLLSIVIIARNEAVHIASAVESVLHEAEQYLGTEIVLVDSASVDETVEIASAYPIGVIRLPASWFLSAAAGRHIGYLNTSGKFILYLDGDMTLYPGWLAKTIPYMMENPQVAGCSGYWENIDERGGKVVRRERQEYEPDRKIRKVNELGGAALYRRSALEEVGGFNPYIYSYEEPELCARLRYAGYQLVYLPDQISRHYGLPEHSLASYWRRWKNNLWIGCGQMLRYHLGKKTFVQVARLQGGSYLISTMAGLLGVISLFLLGLILQSLWPVLLGASGIAVFLVLLLYRKRSLSRALLSLLQRVLIVLSGMKGFVMLPRDAATYPTEAEIVRPVPSTSFQGKD